MNTVRTLGPRPVRSLAWVCAVVWSGALLGAGGCSSEDSPLLAGAGTASIGGSASGPTSTAGTFSAAGTTSPSGGGSATGGVNTGSGGMPSSSGGTPSNTGGTPGATGGTSSGGTTSGGMSAGGTGGSAPKPCVDVQPPPDPEWPGATCQEWATETEECGKAWFKDYCDVSCKRCTPAGGTGGSGAGGSGGTGGAPAVDCSTKGLPNVSGGNGYATRYWDCCQPHCAQFDGHRCEQNGTSRTGNNQSSCSGGGSYACYDEAPKAVNECLSYGYIAKSNPNCGACYRIQFTGEGQHNAADPGSKLIKGKQMIVKVSNTGGDVASNQFDLMVPGGGVGQFNACSKQWGTNDLGAQYGGFLTNCSGSHAQKKECVRQNCMKIPAGPARDGCIWFVDWFQVADNPKFTSQQTDCPF